MGILFSVIVPVFNSEKYVASAIKSILRQPFSKKKYEIILINDHSSDKTKLIIQSFKKKFKNIKVINNKKNYKVSYSRNIGIKSAIGKYIIFLDSDDELKKNTFNKLEKLVLTRDYDLILCLEYQSNKKRIDAKKVTQIDNVESFINYDNQQRVYNPNCWNMVLNKSFLHKKKIFFKKIDIFEDQVFCTEALLAAKKFRILPNTFYNYILRPLSLSRNTSYLALKSCLYVLINFLKILKKTKLSKAETIFIQNRIDFITKIFKIYLNVCNSKQIKKIGISFQKFSNKTKKENNIFFNKHIKVKAKFFKTKKLLKLKNKMVHKIQSNNFNDYSKIYIFGYGVIGRTVFHVLKNNNVKIAGFIDNNKNFFNATYFRKKIINIKSLKKITHKQNNDILVIICQNISKTSNQIIRQLKHIGLEKKNIKVFNIF
tara:strand:- start:705 stop:1991 length:1287 start_codon:yes stop_codon:yes gene_type:complete